VPSRLLVLICATRGGEFAGPGEGRQGEGSALGADISVQSKDRNTMPPPRELSARERIFVREYLVDLNATQAAVRAGYSPRRPGKLPGPALPRHL